eukprot:TRINITY_DN7324_c0_g1_i1.p1 TRINITY_DN7324_c0_g1~~TRINITY_DN7324_c0_g1_i1.p1  ORF type:complete len:187 (+),score=20.90 TRINITY_DN7324_c0_g1_i1:55-615(+)
MFKKFVQDEYVSSATQLKSSIGRAIKAKLQEQMPNTRAIIDVLFPKKSPIYQIKSKDRIMFVACAGEVLFFQQRDGPWFPTLRLLQKYPNLLPPVQVDRGAIKFVMSGADIMCPGLTSPGGKLEVDVDAGMPVAVFAEGKTHPLAIGETVMSVADIKSINQDVGIKSVTFLNDGLWHLDPRPLNIN